MSSDKDDKYDKLVENEGAFLMLKKSIEFPNGYPFHFDRYRARVLRLNDVLKKHPVNVYSSSLLYGKYLTPLMLAILTMPSNLDKMSKDDPIKTRDNTIISLLYYGANPYLTDEKGQNMIELYKKQLSPSKDVLQMMTTDLLKRYKQLPEDVKTLYLGKKKDDINDITNIIDIKKYDSSFDTYEQQLFDWMSNILNKKVYIFDYTVLKDEEDYRRFHKLVLDCTMSLFDFIVYKVCNGLVNYRYKLHAIGAACFLTAMYTIMGFDLEERQTSLSNEVTWLGKGAFKEEEILEIYHDILKRTDWQGCSGLTHIERVYPIGKEEEEDEKDELPPSYDLLFPEHKSYSYRAKSTKPRKSVKKSKKSGKSVKKSRKSVKSVKKSRKSVKTVKKSIKSVKKPRKSIKTVKKSIKSVKKPRKSVKKSRKSVKKSRKSVKKSRKVFGRVKS